jgi:hypothetical protein
VLEHDPALFSQCEALEKSPSLSVVRFDKTTKYSIIPRSDKYNYKPAGSAPGVITRPYGVTLSNGSFKQLRPTELIRDHRGIWRDGSGGRLRQPKSTLHLLFAELHDFFRTSRGDFDYHLPTSKLVNLAIDKSSVKNREHPFACLGIIGLTIAATPDIKRVRGRSTDDRCTESSVGSRIPSPDRRYLR